MEPAATPRCPGATRRVSPRSTSVIAGGPVNQLLFQPGGYYESAP
jgi:hypothetical protein